MTLPIMAGMTALNTQASLYLAKCNVTTLLVAVYPMAGGFIEDAYQSAEETIDLDAPFNGKALADWVDRALSRYIEIRKGKMLNDPA